MVLATRGGETLKDSGGGQPGGTLAEEKVKARPCLCPLPGKSTHLVPQALTFIIFICFTASISAYMAAALLEFFITLAFLFLYATQYYQRFDRLNWPCLVRDRSPPPYSSPLNAELSFPLQPLPFSWVPQPDRALPQAVPCTQKLLRPH